MRKIIVIAIAVFFGLSLKASYAEPGVSPHMLENFIRRICPMYNVVNGEMLEVRYRITEFRDGHWTCDDRAEFAKRIADQFGYETTYRISKTANPKVFHRYIVVTDDDGTEHEILQSRFLPTRK